MDRTQQQQIYDITRPHHKLLTLYTLRSLLTTVLFPIIFLRLYFKYHTLKYRFDGEGIAMSWAWKISPEPKMSLSGWRFTRSRKNSHWLGPTYFWWTGRP